LNQLGKGRFQGHSAGSHPAGKVNPFTLEALRRMNVPTDGLRSKSWDEFAAPGASPLDFVFTVCGRAAGEVCPVWPGQPMTAHWGVDDPAAIEGTAEQKGVAFWNAATLIRRRIELFLSLPLERIDALSLRYKLADRS
jgi:arsenate reductase (thioredoxin)